jgi:hypothetical protein
MQGGPSAPSAPPRRTDPMRGEPSGEATGQYREACRRGSSRGTAIGWRRATGAAGLRREFLNKLSIHSPVPAAGRPVPEEKLRENDHRRLRGSGSSWADDRHLEHTRAIAQVLAVADVGPSIGVAVPSRLKPRHEGPRVLAGFSLNDVTGMNAAGVPVFQQAPQHIGAIRSCTGARVAWRENQETPVPAGGIHEQIWATAIGDEIPAGRHEHSDWGSPSQTFLGQRLRHCGSPPGSDEQRGREYARRPDARFPAGPTKRAQLRLTSYRSGCGRSALSRADGAQRTMPFNVPRAGYQQLQRSRNDYEGCTFNRPRGLLRVSTPWSI